MCFLQRTASQRRVRLSAASASDGGPKDRIQQHSLTLCQRFIPEGAVCHAEQNLAKERNNVSRRQLQVEGQYHNRKFKYRRVSPERAVCHAEDGLAKEKGNVSSLQLQVETVQGEVSRLKAELHTAEQEAFTASEELLRANADKKCVLALF